MDSDARHAIITLDGLIEGFLAKMQLIGIQAKGLITLPKQNLTSSGLTSFRTATCLCMQFSSVLTRRC